MPEPPKTLFHNPQLAQLQDRQINCRPRLRGHPGGNYFPASRDSSSPNSLRPMIPRSTQDVHDQLTREKNRKKDSHNFKHQLLHKFPRLPGGQLFAAHVSEVSQEVITSRPYLTQARQNCLLPTSRKSTRSSQHPGHNFHPPPIPPRSAASSFTNFRRHTNPYSWQEVLLHLQDCPDRPDQPDRIRHRKDLIPQLQGREQASTKPFFPPSLGPLRPWINSEGTLLVEPT
jgi:hypothetical protein